MLLRLHIETNARTGAGARAGAELWFRGIDALGAVHAAGLLREPVDAKDRAVGGHVLITKKELEGEGEHHDCAGRKKRRSAPLRKRLQPFLSTVHVEPRHGVQNDGLLNNDRLGADGIRSAALLRPEGARFPASFLGLFQ